MLEGRKCYYRNSAYDEPECSFIIHKKPLIVSLYGSNRVRLKLS